MFSHTVNNQRKSVDCISLLSFLTAARNTEFTKSHIDMRDVYITSFLVFADVKVLVGTLGESLNWSQGISQKEEREKKISYRDWMSGGMKC